MSSGSASLLAVSLLYTHTAQTQDPDKNWQASFRRWVTHTDAQSQRCHLHTSSTSYELERKMKQKKIQNKTNKKKKQGGRVEQDLQKINRVYSFKGYRHRHFIVQANYQWKIITTDGFRVTDFSYALHLCTTDDEMRELSRKGKTSFSKRTLYSRWGPSKAADYLLIML